MRHADPTPSGEEDDRDQPEFLSQDLDRQTNDIEPELEQIYQRLRGVERCSNVERIVSRRLR